MGDASVLSHCSLLRNYDQNRPVCWSIVIREKQTVGSPFFGAFLSDSIAKAMKDVSAHFFIHSFTLRYEFIRDNALVVRTSYKLY